LPAVATYGEPRVSPHLVARLSSRHGRGAAGRSG
jgi:hypothetical protein